jgi:hypothetical protein
MRQFPLPHEIQYFLDGAIDAQEITPITWFAANLFGETAQIDAILQRPCGEGRGWANGRRLICLDLEDYACELIKAKPISTQRAIVACVLAGSKKWMADIAECLAGWNYEDSIRGGCLMDFRDVVRHDSDYRPTRRLARHLRAPRAIRRYVKRSTECVPHARDLAERVMRLAWPRDRGEMQVAIDLLEAQRQIARRCEDEARARFFVRHPDAAPTAAPTRRDAHRGKNLARAALAASSILGGGAVADFIRGAAVRIEGQSLVLEARRAGTLDRAGHGSCVLRLLDPSGAPLAGICCYFEDTPALDQLAAFALHMQSGEERAIIETGNLYAVSPAAADHPLLKGRVRVAAEQLGGDALTDRRLDRPLAGLRAAQAAYWGAQGPIYLEAVTTAIWGRRASDVREFWRAA